MSVELLIIKGPGVVARRGEAVLWAESSDLRREGLLAEVVARMGALPTGQVSPPDFADWLVGELSGPRGATIPALAFTVPVDGQVLCVVHGWGRVTAPGGTVTASGAPARIPTALPLAVGRADLAVLADGDSLLDLRSGTVPGGAALLLHRPTDADSPEASSAAGTESADRAPAPVPEPEAAQPQQPVESPPSPAQIDSPVPAPIAAAEDGSWVSLRPELTEAPPPREPLPVAQPATGPDGAPVTPVPSAPAGPRAAIVTGIRCSRQHFNNPGALYCRICGISMLQQTHVQVQGERPALGVLVCDDGSTYGLDGDYAIGSDPRAEPGVVSGLAEPLVIGDAAAGVAPTHVIIHLDGWEVLALNRSPGLPAAVLHRGDTQWTPLPPGQWARLAPGSYVGFAGRHIVFESNNRA